MKDAAFKGMVRPILEYGSSVWDPHIGKLQEELEKVQNRAERFVKVLRNTKTGFLRCIGYPSFIKDRIKLGSLQILALVELQKFQNY